MRPRELPSPTAVSVLMRGLTRHVWRPVPAGDFDELVGAVLDSISMVAAVLSLALPTMLDAIRVDASRGLQ